MNRAKALACISCLALLIVSLPALSPGFSVAEPSPIGQGDLMCRAETKGIEIADIDWDAVIDELDAGFEQPISATKDPDDLVWYFKTSGWIVSKPLIDVDGTVYFGAGDGNFYALDATGQKLWSYNVGVPIVADAIFDSRDRIVVGALDGAIYFLNKDGTLDFSFWTGGPIFSTASVDLLGNIYIGSNDFNLYKLSPDGAVLGTFETGGWIDSRPTFLSDGTLCFSSYDRTIYIVDQDLNEVARFETGTWLTRAFSVGGDNTIYAGGIDGILYAVNPAGTLKWQYNAGQAIFSSPIVTELDVFFGSNAGRFCSVNGANGGENWIFRVSDIEIVSSSPALAPDGKLFFGTSDHKVYGLRQDSIRQFSFNTDVTVGSTTLAGKPVLGGIAIDADGVAYFGNCNGVLFAVDTGSVSKAPVGADLDDLSIGHCSDDLSASIEPICKPVRGAFDGQTRLATSTPNAVDMALKTMCMSRKSLDRPTEVYYRPYPYVEKCVLGITEDILNDAFVGPPFAKELTDSLIFEDSELQDYILTAASPLGPIIARANYNHFLSDTPLRDAIEQIYTTNGVILSEAMRNDLAAQAANLSLELRQAMAMILFAMDDASSSLNQAFEHMSPNAKADIKARIPNAYPLCYYPGSFLSTVFDEWVEGVDFEQLLTAGTTLLSGLKRSEDYFAYVHDSSMAEFLFEFDTPIGFVMVGGAGDNVYNELANGVRERNALLIDIGGNDLYEGRSAGSTGDETPMSIAIDLSGDDVYESDKDGCQGWGFFGIGVLLDFFGNDLYIAPDHSQGSSTFGIGILQDVYGDDLIIGEEMAQGASACGIGLLDNESGNDIYFSPQYAQGFGFTFGSGVLRDVEGNDFYFVGGVDVDFREQEPGQERYVCMGQGFGYGPRRDQESWQGAGGIGILTDGGGNDYYLGDYFAQGSSYWFSTGVLDDKGGDDVYVARRYSTGAGIHNSVGVLVDESGNDEYWGWGVGVGHGLDASVGIVVDIMGDDFYSARGWYMMGHGGDGVGVLIDNAGNDIYSQRDATSLGYAGPYDVGLRRPIGIFVDVDGADAYTTKGNNRSWMADETGVGIDLTAGDSGCLMPE
ncbi:MAG: PQQ-like beta-propeller repeat protein [Candidatus Coatesbacteria bacterium]|nr:PQQ-like beta-propeller repeat protein [Candidatus Coatesbacteria bacterium]